MTLLATRRLGQSDLLITSVGLGTAPIGSTPGWRINWIDTAPFYGWGRAERLVATRERVFNGWV